MNNAEFDDLADLEFDQLLDRAKTGCDDARSALIDRVQSYVSFAVDGRKIEQLKHKCGVSDIVQLSMLEIFKSFDSFRGNTEGEFKAWVRSIVDHQVKQTQRDYARQKRDVFREVSGNDSRNLAAGLVDHQLTPQTDAIHQENQKRMVDAIDSLPEDYKQVIQLRSLDRKPFKEVADVMQRSEDAATKLWFRAVTKLQSMLKRDDESTAGK